MPLPFPHQADVPLERAPVAEVVCQVRFPPILRIAREEPSDFQEKVRGRFPELEIEQSLLVRLPNNVSEGLQTEPRPKIYRFHAPDRQTTISLGVNFYALSTTRYTHWPDFLNDLMLAHTALQAVYQPAYAIRLGLRYIDRFTLANTGYTSTNDIRSLFRPELVAPIAGELWEPTDNYLSQHLLQDDDGARLALRFGYRVEEAEPGFILDFDYYQEGQLALDDLAARCDRYHTAIYNAFRWCLLPEALQVFQPS